MNNFWERLFPVTIIFAFFLGSCADPTFVGEDILDDDRINATFTDTITIESRTVRGDSVLTYSPGPIWLSAYLLGDYQDPIFGNTYSEIYAQPTLELSQLSYLRPDFEKASLDSVVLVLPYNGDGFYGNTEQQFSINVYELMDSMSRDSLYYSASKLATGTLIGSKTFTPSLDSVTFIDYRTTSPDTVSLSQLRIPLEGIFGRRLIFADTSNYLTNADFLRFFRGVSIQPSTPTDGMISFDLVPTNGAYDAGIYVYFKRDTIPTQYRFPISYSSPVSAYMNNDYTGSVVEPAIGNADFSDSLAFVQGTEGLLLELNFPNLEGLRDVVVNKAELLVPVASVSGDNPDLFPSAERLYAFYYNEDAIGNYVPIDDVLLPNSGVIDVVFGGLVEEGANGEPDIYRLNISAWFQEMLKDDRESDIPDVIYLTPSPRSERVSRSILYGAQHPQYPIKLNLTYTSQ
ncbi:DUF4270 family protein [Flavilitoribacter nigricans]|nr:DUF4270 family protein [Flavilitoribacter nigricans]